MHNVMVLGAGKIGALVAQLLGGTRDYRVHLIDVGLSEAAVSLGTNNDSISVQEMDCSQKNKLIKYINDNRIETVISCLPFYCNKIVAEAVCEIGINYYDLTEDVAVTNFIKDLSYESPGYFVSQCGLAPGFISIVANDLLETFDEVNTVKMRVGALPVNVSNSLQYALTWSTAGVINEYSKACKVLENGEVTTKFPLEGLEEIKIDGLTYEAFNTSGGVGSLVSSSYGKIRNMDYKTIRYPGHCSKMKFLMHELKLIEKPELLQDVLENSLPVMTQDVVLVYVSVEGKVSGSLIEKNYTKKFYPRVLFGQSWSAIQMCTASGICTVVDLITNQRVKPKNNFVRQEDFNMADFIGNRFGGYFS